VRTMVASKMLGAPLLWASFVALETLAQVALKVAALEAPAMSATAAYLPTGVHSPWFALSIACDAANLLLWLVILRGHDLSAAIPMSSVTFLSVVGASSLILGEQVQALQALGLLLIGIGVTLVAWDEVATGTDS
jgi:drug/metabolite transporter (DMT)-like permease